MTARVCIFLGMSALSVTASGCSNGAVAAIEQGSNGVEAPQENQVVRPSLSSATLKVEEAPDGSCSVVSLQNGNQDEVLIESCHGWNISECNGIIVAHTIGVRLDSAVILLLEAPNQRDRRVRVENVIAEAVAGTFGRNNEYLQLQILPPRCTEVGLRLPFEGAFIERGVSGPGVPMRGTLMVRSDGEYTVDIGRQLRTAN